MVVLLGFIVFPIYSCQRLLKWCVCAVNIVCSLEKNGFACGLLAQEPNSEPTELQFHKRKIFSKQHYLNSTAYFMHNVILCTSSKNIQNKEIIHAAKASRYMIIMLLLIFLINFSTVWRFCIPSVRAFHGFVICSSKS